MHRLQLSLIHAAAGEDGLDPRACPAAAARTGRRKSVSASLCLLITNLSRAKADEPIEMPLGVWNHAG